MNGTGDTDVAVLGLGYIGLPLAVALADTGRQVVGIDPDSRVLAALRQGRPPFFEPGLEEAFARVVSQRLRLAPDLDEVDARYDAIVICVGTAVDHATMTPQLDHLRAAARAAGAHADADTLVVVRSTVPTGTSRSVVLPILEKGPGGGRLLAMCPERTIQGKAMTEIRSLPQIVGGLDEQSTSRAIRLFASICDRQVPVSSLEAAETVKLICNAHTDLIYGFGNEVGLLAETLGLDAGELISAANADYPRPDLSFPGFVGGSCLVKDPYLLEGAVRRAGGTPELVPAARHLNEGVPGRVVDRVLDTLVARGTDPSGARVLVCGIAYKGTPVTDDVRGSAGPEVARLLSGRVAEVLGHDFVVGDDKIKELGLGPVPLPDGLEGCDAVVVLTNHPGYAAELTVDQVCRRGRAPVVYDMWGLLEGQDWPSSSTYLRLGRG